jgi:hypothetical protein
LYLEVWRGLNAVAIIIFSREQDVFIFCIEPLNLTDQLNANHLHTVLLSAENSLNFNPDPHEIPI